MRRALTGLLASLIPAALAAQVTAVRPSLDWRSVRTRHFDVHYPASMSEWSLDLASRVDAVHDAVSAFVGYSPAARITMIVEDPLNQSNGFASAPLEAPVIVVWPTPPDPSGLLGAYRSWPELLAVHEYAHVAHLVRPTRNPRERRLWRLLPIRFGPLARKAPRWVVEGYATYVEGKLTGSGRPHSAARAAYLRQWALEGRVPTYAQLSFAGRDFAGGAMAYLAGSAFLEWLVDQRGEQSLVSVWRRMSARQQRSFEQSFAGVFRAPPDELYGRFTVELTRRALAVRDSLSAVGIEDGEPFQRRRWATGEPAVSKDGRFVAVTLPTPTEPGPVVVWRVREPVDTARERRARERILVRDPEDVPTPPLEPRPRTAIATLRPRGGRAFHSPRFLSDTMHLLVAREEPLGDGAYRSDLYLWNYRSGAVRRVTRGAGVRDADPLPDGRHAVGTRCEGGVCDVVRVDLSSGAVSRLMRGAVDAPVHRPRVAPDGRSAVVAHQRAGRWRLALVPLAESNGDGALAFVDPEDGANRYDAVFSPDGRSLICISDAGGVPNLERIDIQTGAAHPLSRVGSAAFAPEPSSADSSILFLQLHARGLDLRRLPIGSERPTTRVALSASLAPAAPPSAVTADTFPRQPIPAPRPYGLGPRRHRVLPGGSYSAEGGFATIALIGSDPVGRFTYVAAGALGDRSAWRGGALSAAWRGMRAPLPGTVTLSGALFHAEQRPSRQRTLRGASADGLTESGAATPGGLDADQTGATLGAAAARDFGIAYTSTRIGGSLASLRRPVVGRASRALVFAETRNVLRVGGGGLGADVGVGGHVAGGSTDGLGWTRAIATAVMDVRTPLGSGRLDGTLGTSASSDRFERYAIGGWPSPLIEAPVLSQRIPLPALPAGSLSGRRLAVARASAPLGPVRAFYWLGSVGEDLDRWHRVAGIDGEYPIPMAPALAVPATSIRLGAGYSWDEPFRHRVQAYIGVSYRP